MVLVAVGDEVDTGAIEREIVQQCLDLPRGTIAAKALSHSFVLVVKNMAEVRNSVLYHFISGFAIGNNDRVRAMRACCQAYGVSRKLIFIQSIVPTLGMDITFEYNSHNFPLNLP